MKLLQDLVETVTSTAFVQNVGWLLIHSLWQCMLIALVAFCIARAMRSSSTRYWIYSLALSLMVIAPVVTMLAFSQTNDLSAVNDHSLQHSSAELKEGFLSIEGDDEKSMHRVENEEQSPVAVFENWDAKPASVVVTESIATSWSNSIKAMLNPCLPTIVAVWCCGVLLFSIRPVWGWLIVRRLLRVGTSPVATQVQQTLVRACEKMQVRRRVEVLASTLVGSPIVVGCLGSVILVPASFVSSLPIAQLEAILAHELAHVRRYDYLVNLFQTFVESIFFFHPAVWWVSYRIRIERENCCDDLVVAVFDNKAEYGRALLALEEFRGSVARSALALSARDGSLLHRIRRLFAAPNVGGQRMSAGITAVATAVTSITTVLVFWSAMSAAQNNKEDVPFGEASHGLRARIVALRPDVDDSAPNLELRQSDYVNSDEMTFGIELTNTSDEPVTLAGIRFGDGFAKEVQGKLRTELLGPHWFEFEFMDSEGKPIRRTHREFHEPWQVAESSSTHVLAPNQSMTEVLRPGKFGTPMDIDLPAGKYKVRLHYHGPNEVFREKVGKLWPNKAILNAWPYEVVSNTIDLRVAEGRKLSSGKGHTNTPDGSSLAAELVWGKAVDGLQAAMEYRTAHDASADPAISPGIPIGTSFNVIFHVKNVSDKTITFISETARQGDKVHVTNERGEEVEVKDVWYSGWPIDVVWKLEPGEIAQLSLLTPSLHSLDRPGRYNVRYTIRFNSRIQKDDAGNVIFPRPGDYDKEVDTGVTPLFLTAVQEAASAAKPKTHGATRAGRWQITDDAELEITQKTFHATDIMTSGVIRLKGDKDHPRHVPLSIAMDHFANRERWKAAWEEGQRVLWYAKGQGDGPGRILPPGTKIKIEELRRIDFSNPDCIVHHVFSGWVADQLPSVEIRSALEEEFEIKPDGQVHHRYYESARLGLQPDDSSRQMVVWVGENGKCQVQNLAWAPLTDESEHLKCDLNTLPETLALVLKKFRTKAGQNVPIYAFVTSRPDLPAADLKTVIDVCRKKELKTPELPEPTRVSATTTKAAAQSKDPQSRLNEWKNAWREFYGAQSESDLTFARNAFMDLTGKAATDEDVRAFARISAVDKRPQMIDKLLEGGAFEKFQAQLTSENDAFQSQQQALPSRILRGPQAKSRADVYRTKAGKPVNGLTLAIALRSATNRFRIGERIPLDVLVLNTSKEAITHDFSFDFIANPPRLLDESGNEVLIEKLLLTGTVPIYRETLRSGDTFIYPHIGLGLGENPQPSENWHPHTPVLKPGKYRLTQRWNDLTSGELEIEVVSNEVDNARAKVEAIPTWLRLAPGTQIVEHTDAKFVSGVVVDEEGRPIAGCSVEQPGIVGPETDEQGKFQYKQSVPHRTVLRAYHPDYRLWHGAPELGDVVKIVLHKRPKIEAVNGTREMTARVIDSRTAEPVPNVKVTASRYEGPQNGTVAATAVTNQDGTVVMRGLDFIQHRLLLSADQPVSYIGNLAYPGAEQHEVVMLVDRACELVLRAVDSETGKGIAGVRFDRERALAELWAAPVVNEILGSKQAEKTLTDEDGYTRLLVGPATWSYMILTYPEGYDSIVPIDGRQEVEIETPVGGKVEYTFRLVKKI